MKHTIYDHEQNVEISLFESKDMPLQLVITDFEDYIGNKIDGRESRIYLNPTQIKDLIGILLHIQAKNRNSKR